MEEKFAQLYSENYIFLLQYIKKRVGNLTIAEDIVQDTFFEAYKKKVYFLEHPNPIGWLFKTAKYRILGYEKQNRVRKTVELAEWNEEMFYFEEAYGLVELSLVLELILEEAEVELFDLLYFKCLSIKETADILNLTESNIKVKKHRLMKKMIQRFKEEDVF